MARITAPAPQQLVVAGSFNLLAKVVVADDQPIDIENVTFFLDGIALSRDETQAEFTAPEQQALDDIYDEFEQKYDAYNYKMMEWESIGHYRTAYEIATRLNKGVTTIRDLMRGRNKAVGEYIKIEKI